MRLFMLPQPAGTKAITSQFTERLNAITASDWLDTRRLSLDGEAWWRYEGASYLLPRIPARTERCYQSPTTSLAGATR